MRRSPSPRTVVFLMAFLLAPLSAFGAGQVGEPAANFSLNSTTGVNHTLSDHLGEVVFLFMVGHN